MQRLMIVDLEATCEREGWTGLEMMETIEIGAVVIDMNTYEMVAEFQSFVRPTLHPTLTAFCTELTTIRQEDVDCAPLFPEAFARFCQFAKQQRADAWGSWGWYDLKQFMKDCERTETQMDLPVHVNVKRCFTSARGIGKDVGMKKALHILGIPMNGTHHRGIDDARNIVKTVPFAKAAILDAYHLVLNKTELS